MAAACLASVVGGARVVVAAGRAVGCSRIGAESTGWVTNASHVTGVRRGASDAGTEVSHSRASVGLVARDISVIDCKMMIDDVA